MTNNLASRLRENADRYPDKPAFIIASHDHRWETVTYSQTLELSKILGRGLSCYDICPGTRVVLMIPPSIDFFALVFALMQLGIVPVMIDPAIGLRNFTSCINEAEPKVFFGSALSQGIRALLGWGKKSLRLELSIADLHRAGRSAPEILPLKVETDSEAAIIYTSGSTGLPKGVVYSHTTLTAQIDMLVNALQLRGNEVDIPAFPLFALIDCLLGVTAVIPDIRFPRPADVNPVRILNAIHTHKVDTMFASPVVLDRLARYGIKNQVKIPDLKKVISAGARVPVTVHEMFCQMLTEDAVLYSVYGSTETLPVTIINSHEGLTDTKSNSEQGAGVCVGRPVDGADVQVIPIGETPIAYWDDALILQAGQIGEITVKGMAVTKAYIGRDNVNPLAKIQDADGQTIHRMGDVGYFDAKGRLWYCGRKEHRVVTENGTLFTEMVEGIFNAHSQVHRSALVGVKKAGLLEPVLWVELRKSAQRTDQNQIRMELLELAKGHEMACQIKTILFHPAFPTDVRHNSKIIREKLAILAQKRLT